MNKEQRRRSPTIARLGGTKTNRRHTHRCRREGRHFHRSTWRQTACHRKPLPSCRTTVLFSCWIRRVREPWWSHFCLSWTCCRAVCQNREQSVTDRLWSANKMPRIGLFAKTNRFKNSSICYSSSSLLCEWCFFIICPTADYVVQLSSCQITINWLIDWLTSCTFVELLMPVCCDIYLHHVLLQIKDFNFGIPVVISHPEILGLDVRQFRDLEIEKQTCNYLIGPRSHQT